MLMRQQFFFRGIHGPDVRRIRSNFLGWSFFGGPRNSPSSCGQLPRFPLVGASDRLLHNSDQPAQWKMSGLTITSSVRVPSQLSTGWNLQGTSNR